MTIQFLPPETPQATGVHHAQAAAGNAAVAEEAVGVLRDAVRADSDAAPYPTRAVHAPPVTAPARQLRSRRALSAVTVGAAGSGRAGP